MAAYGIRRGGSIYVAKIRALLEAAQNGHLEVVRYLYNLPGDYDPAQMSNIAEYVDLNASIGFIGNSTDVDSARAYAIQVAARNRRGDVLKWLLENVVPIGDIGPSMIENAIANAFGRLGGNIGDYEIIKLMLPYILPMVAPGGPFANTAPNPLQKAFTNAIENSRTDILELLLRAGADPRQNMDLPMRIAVQNQNSEMIELLLRAGVPREIYDRLTSPLVRRDSLGNLMLL